jgi:myosin tail region-interacting protein MTI1
MAAMPFKVKAIYAYNSEHDDDLKFPEGQVITVTEEEDDDWYVGEYVDTTGAPQAGLFPKNFVERYEPAPPPRPTRAARPKPAEAPAPEPSSPQLPFDSKPKVEAVSKPAADVAPPSASSEEASAPVASPKPMSREFQAAAEPPPAPKPAQATPAKGPPPPVAEKSSFFKDRLNLFNKGGGNGPPIAPFKPGGAAASTFIKKPFVAPPPSRNAFVPQAREPPPQKIYRREEDPEIAQRRAEDDEAAQKAGLATRGTAEGEEEDAPKPVSLKERIALLQQQQQEQAARRADTSHKKKPERPPKKRTESHDAEEAPARDSIDTDGERNVRGSSDMPREQLVRRPSKGLKAPEIPPREVFSDGNEADQSAAGETTEDNERDSSTEDETTAQRHHQAPAAQADVGDEEDLTEEGDEGEEDEVDEEVRRQNELRERMMRISGGMGMPGMFNPMAGIGGGLPKKKKPTPEKRIAEETEPSVASSAPRIPIPGMGARTMSQESGLTAGKDEEGQHEEVADHEVVRRTTSVRNAAPAVPKGTPPPPWRLPSQFSLESHIGNRESRSDESSAEPMLRQHWRLASDGAGTDTSGYSLASAFPQEHQHWDPCSKAVARKPLSPFQHPQLRFTTGLTYSSPRGYLSQQSALRWVLGGLEIISLCSIYIYMLTEIRAYITNN